MKRYISFRSQSRLIRDPPRCPEATAEFTKATELNPQFVEAQNNLGIALARQGKTDEAASRFRDAIAANPNYAEAHNNLGIALLSGVTPDPTGAEKEFQVAISINPHYADAQSNLGILYWQQGEDAKAEPLFRRAIESNFKFIKGYVSLANMLASESKFVEADAVLQKAQAVAPANVNVQSLRAQLKSQMQK